MIIFVFQCLSPSNVLELSGIINTENVSTKELSTLSAILVHLYENSSCMKHEETQAAHHAHQLVSSAEGKILSLDTVKHLRNLSHL